MAKQTGIINIRGKVGDAVYTGGKYGNLVRTAPELTEAQRKAKAASPQLKRIAAQNGIAGTINTAVAHYAGALKPGNFYQNLHKIFAEEVSPERTLKLRRVWNLEINENYSFAKAGLFVKPEVKPEKHAYKVEAEVYVPHEKYRDNNSLSLEFIMIVFEKGTDECRYPVQYSDWMYIEDRTNKYISFEFPRKPKDTDYILACRAVFAVNGKEDGYWSSAVMRFLTGNAVTMKGLKLIADADAGRKQPKDLKQPKEAKLRVEVRDKK